MKKLFELNTPYQFDINDIWCVLTMVQVILIIKCGLMISWFGLGLAVAGIVQDFLKTHRINGVFTHLAMVALNTYFLLIYYDILTF